MTGYMTIILELAAPGSHQWRVLGRGSAPLWVLRAFIDVSDCTLHGLFVHHLAQRSSVGIPASQRRGSTLPFWVLSAQSGATGIWGPFKSLSFCGSGAGQQPNHISAGHDARASGKAHAAKEKKLFPDCTNCTNQWELQGSQLPTCPILCASCGLPALFLEEKAVAGKQGNLDLSPPWHSSAVPPALVCALLEKDKLLPSLRPLS